MATFSRLLSQKLGGPIHDQTGLTGTYDIDLTWAADVGGGTLAAEGAGANPAEVAGDPGASVFTAIRESLGLKLEPRKLPVEMVYLDHLDRVPSQN